VREQGFTVVIDMRGATWSTVKPILKVLQEHFPGSVHIAYIIKPDNFWQKQRTSLGSHKYKFEVSVTMIRHEEGTREAGEFEIQRNSADYVNL
jgi:hypothetical protein